MIYKLQNGGIVKLQNAWRRVPTSEEIEQVPTQVSTTSVRTAPVETQFKTVRRKPTESEKSAKEIARIILEEAANKSTGRASGIGNRDLSLQNEYPELILIPAAAEIKAAKSVGTGLLRTAAGTIVGDEMARGASNIGQKIDNALSTRMFTPTLGFIGGLGGYALGSNMIGGIASGLRLPRKYRVEPINKRTYFAEDQTPKYNPNQLTDNRFVSEIEKLPYQTPKVFQGFETQRGFASDIPVITKENAASITDAQWDAAYNEAIRSENITEAQRLRDLHFAAKAPNAPQYNFYHGTFNKEQPFYVFEPQSNNELFFHFSPYKDTAEKFMGIAKTRNKNGRLITAKLNIQHPTTVTDSGWWNWYRIPEANPRISKILRMDGSTAGQYYSDLLLKEPSVSEANGKMMDMLGNDAFMYKNYTEDTGRISIAIPRSSQIKLADPITRTNTGQIIPLSKRDDFGNPDIRYSKGNPTGSEIFAERYDGNPLRWDNINKDISVGRTEAINYLNSKRKQLTDQHNIDIAKRLFDVDITPESNPGIRASTDMQFTSTPILKGTWYPKFGIRLTFDPNNTTKGNTVFNYRDPTLDEISLDLSSDLEDAALHEWLHRGNIGEGRGDITRAFYKWKTQKLLKPEFWNDEYFGNPQEATTNLIEIGRRNGITNAKYPGFNKAIEQLRYIIDNDTNKGYLLNKTRWETKPKRVWDALQGKYMGLIPIGLGTNLMLNENE